MLRRVLIANRGEIALRIIRTCRELGLSTVAVYSEADAGAPHVEAADEAVPIGPASATESYLNIPNLIRAARQTKADAIHPGYGFLSENAEFARACEEAGIRFVGPPASVIARVGVKTLARQAVREAGVPVVPGEVPASQQEVDIGAAVQRVGMPVILKAASGGGGRGMRIVRSPSELPEALAAVRREVRHAFGESAIYVERLIDRPRHVEVQVIADTHGSVVHLFERDCTLQRRHQKVIEEAPAPTISEAVREQLTDAAVKAARAVGYVNAGTVEFLLTGAGDAAEFYFLEMNTRLQVEHPITEAITGLDLVRAQLIVAAGEPLPFSQSDVHRSGHAVECRVYAEDSQRLLPQSGTLLRYREPQAGGIRVDSGVREGQLVTVHYDPLLAKVIAHGTTRADALARVEEALRQFEILGVRHNIPFLLGLLSRDEVVGCRTHTRFIDEHIDELAREPPDETRRIAAAIAAWTAAQTTYGIGPVAESATPPADMSYDPFDLLGPVSW